MSKFSSIVLHYLGFNTLARMFLKEKIYVINYHSVSSPSNAKLFQYDLYSHLSINLDLFKSHIQMMQKRGHTFIQPGDLLKQGVNKMNKPTILYFDDGFKDNLANALPVLKNLGIKASIFVSPVLVDKVDVFWTIKHRAFLKAQGMSIEAVEKTITRLKTLPKADRESVIEKEYKSKDFNWSPQDQNIFLDWPELKKLRDEGWEISSHGLSHQNLLELDPKEIKKELLNSKERIEKELGKPVESFSYPHGRFNDNTNRMLSEIGYKVVMFTGHGLNNFKALNRLPIFLKTIPVKINDTLKDFESKLYSRHFLRS